MCSTGAATVVDVPAATVTPVVEGDAALPLAFPDAQLVATTATTTARAAILLTVATVVACGVTKDRTFSGDAASERPYREAMHAAEAVKATKVYGEGQTAVTALKDVDVSFESGRYTAIMGPSGSGKSTLMHCLAGLDRLTSGVVMIGGTDLSKLDDRQLTALRRDRIGFVFQTFNLVPTLTAIENITLPMALGKTKPDTEWLDQVIDAVGLADRLNHRPSELSGGQQQRVACARALANQPDVVFADEPTGNLDSKAGAEVLAIMRRSVDDFGRTVVMVTHDPVAAAYADRVVFLVDGEVVDEMPEPNAERVLDHMKLLGA
jgi:putative ABC transport system ATP-binding protein